MWNIGINIGVYIYQWLQLLKVIKLRYFIRVKNCGIIPLKMSIIYIEGIYANMRKIRRRKENYENLSEISGKLARPEWIIASHLTQNFTLYP